VALSFNCGKQFVGTRSIFIFSLVCCSDDGVLLGRGPGCGVEEGDSEEEVAARPRSERRLGRVIVGGLGRVCLPEPFQIKYLARITIRSYTTTSYFGASSSLRPSYFPRYPGVRPPV
jgi:hypothetical protein